MKETNNLLEKKKSRQAGKEGNGRWGRSSEHICMCFPVFSWNGHHIFVLTATLFTQFPYIMMVILTIKNFKDF